jgi:AcrR family transcriptional regulator
MSANATEERILAATLDVLTGTGLARLALEDVARQAGVSRQTVYRYFGNRETLVREVILREERRFIARIEAEAARHDAFPEALEAAIATALREARAHPLLDRLLAAEPEALLPFLLASGGPLLSAARPVLAELLRERLPTLAATTVHRAADAMTRLLISYAVDPPEEPPERVARELADLVVRGLGAP